MTDWQELVQALDGVPATTNPTERRQKSRDFYWYSPILKSQLDDVVADLIVSPRNEADVVRTLAACHARQVPVTVRGCGTGNYGQAMPIQGGVVLDVSGMTAIKWIRQGSIRVEAGVGGFTGASTCLFGVDTCRQGQAPSLGAVDQGTQLTQETTRYVHKLVDYKPGSNLTHS